MSFVAVVAGVELFAAAGCWGGDLVGPRTGRAGEAAVAAGFPALCAGFGPNRCLVVPTGRPGLGAGGGGGVKKLEMGRLKPSSLSLASDSTGGGRPMPVQASTGLPLQTYLSWSGLNACPD